MTEPLVIEFHRSWFDHDVCLEWVAIWSNGSYSERDDRPFDDDLIAWAKEHGFEIDAAPYDTRYLRITGRDPDQAFAYRLRWT